MHIEGLKWQISFRWAFEIKSQDPVGDTYLRSLQAEYKKEMDLFLFICFFLCLFWDKKIWNVLFHTLQDYALFKSHLALRTHLISFQK